MKASLCGTWTEQVMFRQGYLTSKERQAACQYGQKCINCQHISWRPADRQPSCDLGGFMVTQNGTCNKWKSQP